MSTTKDIGAELQRQQDDLRRNGLVTKPDGIWLSPCGTFALDQSAPTTKRRPRIYLGRGNDK